MYESKTLEWLKKHLYDIVLVGGIIIAYRVGRISGYEACYRSILTTVKTTMTRG